MSKSKLAWTLASASLWALSLGVAIFAIVAIVAGSPTGQVVPTSSHRDDSAGLCTVALSVERQADATGPDGAAPDAQDRSAAPCGTRHDPR